MNELSANNLSRKLFNDFIEVNLVERVDQRNVFEDRFGKRYAFCISTKYGEIICKQFYDDCDALVCLNLADGNFYEVPKSRLHINSAISRMTPKFQARVAVGSRIGAMKAPFNAPKFYQYDVK